VSEIVSNIGLLCEFNHMKGGTHRNHRYVRHPT